MCPDTAWRERLAERLVAIWALASRQSRGLLRPGSTAALVILAAVAAGAALKAQDVPDAGTWEAGTPLNDVLTVVGVLAGLSYLLVVLGYRRALRKQGEERDFYAVCRDLSRIVHELGDIPVADLAVHAWTVSGLPGGRHLVRRVTFQHADRASSPVKWTKGKGAIGGCWETGEEALHDLSELHNLGLSRDDFCALTRQERLGLSWADYQATKRYKAVWVTPILKGPDGARKTAGCLSIDVVGGQDAFEKLDKATKDNRELVPVLAVCHAVL